MQQMHLVTHVKTYPRLGLAILTVPGCKASRYIPVHGIVGGRMRCMTCKLCPGTDMQLSTYL